MKLHIIRKVASPYVQVALQPHESRKLNLVASEKSGDFSFAIKRVAIIFLLIITILGTVQVFATNDAQNNDNTSENGIVNNEVAGELIKVKEHTKKEIQDKIDLYGSESYGMTAYILEKVRLYSIPLCFIGIAVGAIFQYVIGIRKLDLRDKGLKLIVAFITILVICQVIPLVFAIVVRGWRG